MEIASVEDIGRALTGQGTLEWLGESKSAALLYFSRGRKQYKIFFDDSNVEISRKRRLFQNEYWDSLGVRHYDQPEDSVRDVYETVLWCLESAGKDELLT